MRLVQSAFAVLLLGIPVAACINARDDCDKNPLHCWRPPCTLPTDCPEPADKCNERTCTAGRCGEVGRDCGNLSCNPETGKCKGCVADEPGKQCPTKECQKVNCNTQSECEESPAADKTSCADDNGYCHAGTCELMDGRPCAEDVVCASGVCANGVCCHRALGKDCGGGRCRACDGATCADDIECVSGFCVDGVCCDTACDKLCQTCKAKGAEGTCLLLPEGTDDPKHKCKDLGGCGLVAGYCRCRDGKKGEGEADVDCGGTCDAKCTIGRKCKDPGDCASDNCVDEVCCNSPCTGQCVACNLNLGLCSHVQPGTPDDACVSPRVCDTNAQCSLPNENSNNDTCSADSQCVSRNCNEQTEVCESCNDPADCDPNSYSVCVNGICLKKAGNGADCQDGPDCESGNCVDGVCCNAACDGLCMGCHGGYTGLDDNGICAPILKGLDPHGECDGPGAAAACSGDPEQDSHSGCGTSAPQN